MNKIIAVIGSRNFSSKKRVFDVLDELYGKYYREADAHGYTSLISGGASGPDMWAEEWAKTYSMPVEVIRPINMVNPKNFLYRNIEILTKADELVAFWDGKSAGTIFTVNYAHARKMKVHLIKDERKLV